MAERRVDVAIIGAGTAGLTARREVERAGRSLVMIEGGPYGTTCARVGCMPSKLLIAAADRAHDIEHAEEFGLRPGPLVIDGRAVLERVRRLRDRFVSSVTDAIDDMPAEQKIRGRARFVAPNVLDVDGHAGGHTRVEAKAVVIATGARPHVPSSLQGAAERILTSDDIFDIEDLPTSAAVVGTGIIGLEIGQALSRLGVRTSFFSDTDRLGQATDPEVRKVVREVLERELELHLGVSVEAERRDGGCVVRWQGPGGGHGEGDFAVVVAATGRRPNVDGLGLEVCGIALDERGVPLFDPRTMQCSNAPIFIAGDADGVRPLLHEASHEGHIAGANAARYPEVRASMRSVPLSVTFTDPQIAIAGCAYRDLDLDGVEIGEVRYEDQGRARVMGKNAGIVRIYARRDCGTLVGAEMFGPRVEHTSHLLAWSIQSQLSVERALEMPFYHPVVEEGIRTALRDLSGRLKVGVAPRPNDLECGPGT
jgi:dihydrolipoamide dehydrogenase